MRTHLAILREPYLTLILVLEKTIESRFTKVMALPYGRVSVGDRILLKKSGGLVVGEAYILKVMYFRDLSREKILELAEKYKNELRITPEFLQSKLDSKYITLIWLERVKRFDTPYTFKKNDQRSWIILEDTKNGKKLDDFLETDS